MFGSIKILTVNHTNREFVKLWCRAGQCNFAGYALNSKDLVSAVR